MTTPQPIPPPSSDDDLDLTTLDAAQLAALGLNLDEVVSDEEADAEIDAPALPSPAVLAPVIATAAPDPTTPSVRIAIDKAADILRELRGH